MRVRIDYYEVTGNKVGEIMDTLAGIQKEAYGAYVAFAAEYGAVGIAGLQSAFSPLMGSRADGSPFAAFIFEADRAPKHFNKHTKFKDVPDGIIACKPAKTPSGLKIQAELKDLYAKYWIDPSSLYTAFGWDHSQWLRDSRGFAHFPWAQIVDERKLVQIPRFEDQPPPTPPIGAERIESWIYHRYIKESQTKEEEAISNAQD